MKPALTKVGSTRVVPGKWTHGKLRVAQHPDGSWADIPLWIGAGPNVHADKKTIVAALTGGAHGDEPNGPELVNRVVDEIDPKELKGILLVLPVMNPWGYAERLRMVPIDQRDLNRCYPGHAQGSFSFQVADVILRQVVQHCDFVIDCHDAGTRIVLSPHPRAHVHPDDDPSHELALAFGSDIIMLREAEQGMLAREARATYGTPVVSLEIGGAMLVLEPAQESAKRGVFNILRSQGLLTGPIVLPPHQHILRTRHTILATMSGIQTNWVDLGQVVQVGDPLYRITDPMTGKKIVHRARTCGVVLAKNLSARIDKDDPSISLLEFTSCDGGAVLKTDVVKNQSGKHVTILKSAQSWSHLRHRL